jgi:hypothetical protein
MKSLLGFKKTSENELLLDKSNDEEIDKVKKEEELNNINFSKLNKIKKCRKNKI